VGVGVATQLRCRRCCVKRALLRLLQTLVITWQQWLEATQGWRWLGLTAHIDHTQRCVLRLPLTCAFEGKAVKGFGHGQSMKRLM
jgi:hypothetical protein